MTCRTTATNRKTCDNPRRRIFGNHDQHHLLSEFQQPANDSDRCRSIVCNHSEAVTVLAPTEN
jgi:hypothetical protein